eukprot:m.36372 g.36372  ORF g.36372 m.36372 type:complete len:87 (-) comp14477_c0_seq2:236-496(-)
MNFVLVCDSGRISPASFTNAAIAPSAAQPLTASITRCEEKASVDPATQPANALEMKSSLPRASTAMHFVVWKTAAHPAKAPAPLPT